METSKMGAEQAMMVVHRVSGITRVRRKGSGQARCESVTELSWALLLSVDLRGRDDPARVCFLPLETGE